MSDSKRETWKRRTVKLLEDEGPHSRPQIKEKLKVPEEEKRTFYRGIKELEETETLGGEYLLHLRGQEEPECIMVSVGPKALRITVPLQKELAKRLINKRPIVKNAIIIRGGFAYEVLKEAGIIEEDTR